MDKIKLDLFNLKSKEDLLKVHQFFTESIKKWFNNDKSPNSEYFHFRSCPLCGSDSSKLHFEIDSFSYHRCLSCYSLYTKPHLKDGILDALYSDGTYQVYQDSLVKKGSKIRKGVLEQRKYHQIERIIDKGSLSLLDVGCGGGTFLEVCKEKGWKVEGVDPSPEGSSLHNIKIHQGDFNLMSFEKKYDVITFWGVLEHLSEPILAMTKAKELLSKKGMMVFEVPSADCFIGEYLKKYPFSPTRYIESGRHNIFFSKKLIEQVAGNLEMEIALIETNGLDIQTILLEEFDEEITDKIINMQDIINDALLGDHFRVFLKNLG